MKCPKCKFENPQISDICQNCGLKFKIKCPSCSTMNKIGTPVCTNCSATLIRFCPDCGAANTPGSLQCRKCSAQLLIKCPSCASLNVVNADRCVKCGISLREEQILQTVADSLSEEEENSTSQTAEDMPNLFVELTNYELLKEKISDDAFFQKLMRRFYQVVIKTINDEKIKILKIKPNLLAIEFSEKEIDLSENIAAVIYLSQSIYQAFFELNKSLKEKSDIYFDIKEFIMTEFQIEEEKLFAFLSQVPENSIVCDKKSYELSKELLDESVFELLSDNLCKVLVESDEVDIDNNIQQEEIIKEEVVDIIEEKDTNPKYSRESVVKLLVDKISYANPYRFISLHGPDGAGKSAILNVIIHTSVGEKNLILFSECCELFSLKPFGLFQDIIRTILGLPLLNIEREETIQQIETVFKDGVFSGLSDGTKNVIKDFLVPPSFDFDDLGFIESSTTRRDQIYLAFEEIFSGIKNNLRLVFIIEDIEFIDESSLELFEYLIDNGLLNSNSIMIVTQASSIPSEIIVNSSNLTPENSLTINLESFKEEEAMKCIDGFTAQKPLVSLSYKEEIFKKSKGIPLYVQNAMLFFLQINAIEPVGPSDFSINPNMYGITLPDTLEELIVMRLDDLFKKYKNSYKVMCYAAMAGYIFSFKILQTAMNMEESELKSIFEIFARNHFVSSYDGKMYFFRNKLIVKTIKKYLIKEGYDEEINFDLLQASKQILDGDNFYCATLAKKANQNAEAFVLYGKATKEALYCGDMNLYLKAQKNLLELFDFAPFEDKEERKKRLCIELGKANYLSCPQDAVGFLTEALQLISTSALSLGKEFEVVDILGYLSKSFMLCGNFQGALQAIEQAVRYINTDKMPVEYALLCSLKMKILLKLGNIGEVIDLCNNSVLPVINDAIQRKVTIAGMTMPELRQTRQNVLLNLARAYAMQGNEHYEKVLEAADLDDTIMTKNNIEAFITRALYKSLQGDIISSEEALRCAESISESVGVTTDINLLWTFIKLLNESLCGKFENTESRILILSQQAKKANNSLIYNFSTLLMARYFREIKEYEKAKAIINDRVNYFSQQKISVGALFCWYLIGCIFLEEKNFDDAVSVAKQSIEVSQKPGINNIFFTICFEKLLADCYIAKQDFEMVNIHIEKAMKLAKNNKMYFSQCRLYSLMAKAYYEIALSVDDAKAENAQNAYDLYKIAFSIASQLENDYLKKQISLDISTLKAYCNLQKIELKDGETPARFNQDTNQEVS